MNNEPGGEPHQHYPQQPYGMPPPQGQWAPPPPPPPKVPLYKKKRFLIPLGLLAALIGWTAVNGSTGTTKQEKAAESPAGQPKAAPEGAAVGTPARDGKFEFTANKATCGITSVGTEYMKSKAQGQFCVIDITVKNIGDKPQTFSDSNQKAYIGETQFSPSSKAMFDYALEKKLDSSNWIKEINPGNQMQVPLLFDIPAGQKLEKVKLHDSMFSGGVTVKL
ncbi:protein of unknown function [Austwickia chelonae]|uniref:DUF4352 domain-containing protein n=1 Tax=Austwickia chelonae NBRC 105200 TaxID=1184607 RepID=K6WA19_9MICO|nr:DUF4352 domain-containing protein [Austwickia chelonae]GAB78682.1 hypothetical protein AUCHE_16_01010 [Austwickia chelonae NBRC 105200]SEW34684.1 protein of unknown function [Austwickia chelonae]